MRTLTDKQKILLENKAQYLTLKESLLKEYKSHAKALEYAEDTFEEGEILEKREKLARQIKELASKLREIENLELEA